MTIVLHLDTEQAALVEAALEFGVVALEARAKRVDPGEVISKAHQLQAIKLQQVQDQMKIAPVPDFEAMADDKKAMVERAFEAWPMLQTDKEKATLLNHLMATCEECRFDQKAHTAERTVAQVDL